MPPRPSFPCFVRAGESGRDTWEQEQGYGVTAGIPTMVVAAAPLDDVLSIAGARRSKSMFSAVLLLRARLKQKSDEKKLKGAEVQPPYCIFAEVATLFPDS